VCWDTIGKFLAGSLPLVIAGGVLYFAWEQYQVNRRQYRLALFDKRLAIYNTVTARCAAVVDATTSNLKDNIAFIRATKDHEFLFGKEVASLMDELWKRGNDLMTLQAVQPSQPDKENEIVIWFHNQLSGARAVFSKYMDFTDVY
jgi:hypothetical protein